MNSLRTGSNRFPEIHRRAAVHEHDRKIVGGQRLLQHGAFAGDARHVQPGAGPGAIDYRVHPLDQIVDGLHRITIRNAPPCIAHGVVAVNFT